MGLWALIIGLRWQFGREKSADVDRARGAVRWLASLAAERGDVVAVTHGAVRRIIADAFLADGWRVVHPPKRKWAHWSVWEITRELSP
jgi:broad specificity phosphatase PhoE